jgi:hypothetical protein
MMPYKVGEGQLGRQNMSKVLGPETSRSTYMFQIWYIMIILYASQSQVHLMFKHAMANIQCIIIYFFQSFIALY